MNILLIVDDFGGGAGNIIQLLAIGLGKQRNRVTICLTNPHLDPRYKLENIEIVHADWNSAHKGWLLTQYKRIRDIRNMVVEKNIEVVISFLDNINTIVGFALWNTKIPLIVSERSNPLVIYPKFPWNYLRRLAYKRADLIVVQFEAFKQFDHNRFAEKCVAIPNIVLSSKYIKDNITRKDISFVSLGRNREIKRFPVMISMFADFLKLVPNATLHLFGAEVDSYALQTLVKEKNVEKNVYLHSAISDVHRELVKYDVYLMTSEQEGFPNAMCEAMACGMPIVAFQCHDGINELVQQEKNGFCIPQDEQGQFVMAMKKLAKDVELRQEMGKKSAEIIHQYNEGSVMRIWEENIKTVWGKYYEQ